MTGLEVLKDDFIVTEDNAVDMLSSESVENMLDFAPYYEIVAGRPMKAIDMYMIEVYNKLYNQIYMVG